MSENGAGYRVRERRVVYANPWLRFEAHAIVHPNGRAGEHGVVIVPASSAVVALEGDEVILARQPRYAVDRVVLEVVKGGAHEGESPFACAQRELAEEIGLRAARWDDLGIAYEVPSILQQPVHLFLARDLSPGVGTPEEIESIEAVRMPLATALDGLVAGEIADGVTAVALVRTARLVGALRIA